MKPESSTMVLKRIGALVVSHLLCKIQLVYVKKAMESWLMLKQSTNLFTRAKFDLCVTDVAFICGYGPSMKRDGWWVSGGNAEQSSDPIWARQRNCLWQ